MGDDNTDTRNRRKILYWVSVPPAQARALPGVGLGVWPAKGHPTASRGHVSSDALGPPGSWQAQGWGEPKTGIQGWMGPLCPAAPPPPCSAPTPGSSQRVRPWPRWVQPPPRLEHPQPCWGQSQLCIVVVWGSAGPCGHAGGGRWGGQSSNGQGCWHQAGTVAALASSPPAPGRTRAASPPARGARWPQILVQRTEKSA